MIGEGCTIARDYDGHTIELPDYQIAIGIGNRAMILKGDGAIIVL